MLNELVRLLGELLDLSLYESKVYATLLIKGSMTLSELSKETGVPKTKIYHVSRSLEEKGFVELIRVRPYRLIIKDPYKVIGEKIRTRCSELETKRQALYVLIEKIRGSGIESFSEIASIKILENEKVLMKYLSNDLRNSRSSIIATVSKTPVKFNWVEILDAVLEAILNGSKFIYLVPGNSMSRKLFINIMRSVLCEKNLDILREFSIHIDHYLIQRILKENHPLDLLNRVELYEVEVDIPLIIVDDKIVYNLFTDPLSNRIVFSVRYENNKYARALSTFLELVRLFKGSRNIINEIRSLCH